MAKDGLVKDTVCHEEEICCGLLSFWVAFPLIETGVGTDKIKKKKLYQGILIAI